MDGFVSAYSKATGRKQRIPRHWLDHPVFGPRFELTPSAKAAEEQQAQEQAEEPSESWKRDRLDQHAAGLGIDTSELRTKADVVAAIAEASARGRFEPDGFVDEQVVDPNTQDSGGTPPSDETPATGDTEEE